MAYICTPLDALFFSREGSGVSPGEVSLGTLNKNKDKEEFF